MSILKNLMNRVKSFLGPRNLDENQWGTKLSLLVAPDALTQIDELVVKTREVSRAAVISKALQMYDGLITEVDKGTVFYT